MIIIKQSIASQMMTENSTLKQIEDVYGRSYLVGLGAEILIIADDSDLVQRIQAQQSRQKGAN